MYYFPPSRNRMSARFNLKSLNLSQDLEDVILANLSSQLIQDARTNPLHRALMDELNEFFHPENNLDKYIELIHNLAN